MRSGHQRSTTSLVLLEVMRERDQQDEKWGVQRHVQALWLAILAEEFGEVAKEVVDGVDLANLRVELIQTAAVAVSFIEALDRGDAT